MVSMQRGEAIVSNESDDTIKEKPLECRKHSICEDDNRYSKVSPIFIDSSVTIAIKLIYIFHYFQIRESISLPCTLRKCKGSDSCRGSNNCYVWAMDFEQLNKRMDKLEKGCPKSKTISADARGSDNECLLPDRTYCSTEDISSPEHQSTSHACNAARDSSSIRSSSVCGATTAPKDLK